MTNTATFTYVKTPHGFDLTNTDKTHPVQRATGFTDGTVWGHATRNKLGTFKIIGDTAHVTFHTANQEEKA